MGRHVPLSRQAIEALEEASVLRDGPNLLFPSPLKRGALLSDKTLTKLLRTVGLAEHAIVHGFRSSFKNWALEQTDVPWAVSGAALAHTLDNSTEQVHASSDLFERRRELMQMWANYVLEDSQAVDADLLVCEPNSANQVPTSSPTLTPVGL